MALYKNVDSMEPPMWGYLYVVDTTENTIIQDAFCQMLVRRETNVDVARDTVPCNANVPVR
jgi:hypothetical protein